MVGSVVSELSVVVGSDRVVLGSGDDEVVVGSDVADPVLPPPPAPSPSAGVLGVVVGSEGGVVVDEDDGGLVVVGDVVVQVVVEVHVVVDRELIEDVAGGVVPLAHGGPPAGCLLAGVVVDDAAVVEVGMSPAAAAPLTVIRDSAGLAKPGMRFGPWPDGWRSYSWMSRGGSAEVSTGPADRSAMPANAVAVIKPLAASAR